MPMAAILLHFLALTFFSMAAPPPEAPNRPGCVAELVAFSPCLPFVSASPNDIAATAPPKCCDAFSSALSTGDGYCLCYLLQQPMLLGFPVNKSMIMSLPSHCLHPNTTVSLHYLCSAGTTSFPPLSSTGGQEQTPPLDSDGVQGNGSEPLISKPPDLVNSSTYRFPPISTRCSPPPPASPVKPATLSSAEKWVQRGNSWFVFAVLIFLLN